MRCWCSGCRKESVIGLGRGNGTLIHLEQQDRDDMEAQAIRDRRRKFTDAMKRAEACGFTERQAPFAAMAFLTMAALGSEPSKAQVRRRVLAQYPWLEEGEA